MYASSFLHWTDTATIFEGNSRDERLVALYRRYLQWCKDNRLYPKTRMCFVWALSFQNNLWLVKTKTMVRFLFNVVCSLPSKTGFTQGIPNGCRARPLLFQVSTLQKTGSAYPSIGQKKLNGAASRMMITFATEISAEIFDDHPTDVNRWEGGNEKMKRHTSTLWEEWCYTCLKNRHNPL